MKEEIMEINNKERLSSKQYELDDEDEDEEKKMDKFYAIIRGFNDARHNYQRSRFLNHNQPQGIGIGINHCMHQTNKVGSDNHHHHTATTWMPSFKWEDFRDAVHRHHHHHQDHQVDKSDTNCVNCCIVDSKKFDTNKMNNFINKFKKRKMNDVDGDDYNEDNDDVTTTTQLKNQRSHQYEYDTGLDLNLAL